MFEIREAGGRLSQVGFPRKLRLSGRLHRGFWDPKKRKQDRGERGEGCCAVSVKASADPAKSSKFTTVPKLSGRARSLLLCQPVIGCGLSQERVCFGARRLSQAEDCLPAALLAAGE